MLLRAAARARQNARFIKDSYKPGKLGSVANFKKLGKARARSSKAQLELDPLKLDKSTKMLSQAHTENWKLVKARLDKKVARNSTTKN